MKKEHQYERLTGFRKRFCFASMSTTETPELDFLKAAKKKEKNRKRKMVARRIPGRDSIPQKQNNMKIQIKSTSNNGLRFFRRRTPCFPNSTCAKHSVATTRDPKTILHLSIEETPHMQPACTRCSTKKKYSLRDPKFRCSGTKG